MSGGDVDVRMPVVVAGSRGASVRLALPALALLSPAAPVLGRLAPAIIALLLHPPQGGRGSHR